jgi:serine phosphatase RsbU (regulator of sigma subunit)
MSNSVVSTGALPKARIARSSLVTAVVGLALACPSALAQLPQLPQLPGVRQTPLKDGAAGELLPGSAVEDVVNEPLPAPVEDVVDQSPVAPVRDELRRVVGGADGASGGGPSAGNPAGAGSSGTPTGQPQSRGSTPGSGGDSSTGRNRGKRQARTGTDSRGTPAQRRRGATGAPTRSAGDRARAAKRRRENPTSDDAQNPVTRSIEKVVGVVPTAIWIGLGVLLVLAAALGTRAFVERRRARELERDRQRLMRDVGALERALMPAVPEMLGALAASVAHRASEGPAAGGDFYDAFELAGGRVAVLVGDVSGHGPDALERTNSIRTALHDRLEAGLSPRAALESVGRSNCLESSGQFATAVVAVHDPADGTLTYAAAGHPPPIITGRGAHEPITTASSPPIGVGLRTGLRETKIPLPAETVACLFTDGLLEARVADDLMGREELTRFVDELGPEQFADSLLAQVVAVADEAPDDMAVCVLRPVAGAETAGPRIETLVVDSEDIALGVAERFLEACDVPAYQLATALEALSPAAAGAGGAVLEVTIDDRDAHVRVTRPDAAYRPAAI